MDEQIEAARQAEEDKWKEEVEAANNMLGDTSAELEEAQDTIKRLQRELEVDLSLNTARQHKKLPPSQLMLQRRLLRMRRQPQVLRCSGCVLNWQSRSSALRPPFSARATSTWLPSRARPPPLSLPFVG